MESRSEASFNVGLQKSPSPSLFHAAQQTPLVFGDLPSSQDLSANTGGERVKRKRGRPRKYAGPDGSMAHGILASPSSISATPLQMAGSSSGFTLSSSAARLESQKKKGKLQSSGKKFQMNALGSSGIGFTPHVITVKVGEDVSAKIMSFSNHGPRAVCILSANGAISNVTLRQASASSGTVTYEGRFEILSLSGSFLVSESSDQRSRTGGLSVSLAGPDGHVLGGGVAGVLVAATPVQVIVGSFIADTASKEPVAIIPSPSAVETGSGRFSPGGLPGPSSPISRGPLSPSSGGGPIFSPPHNQSSNGNYHSGNNSQCLPVMPWN